jgi:murein DD-endopeptidase MepM/ murein hydrolase activator NlpD
VIDAMSGLLPPMDLRPPAPTPTGDEKVQREFEVMLVRQLLQDLKLPGMDGNAAMFSDIIEEALARQIVENRDGGPGTSVAVPRRGPKHDHDHEPAAGAVRKTSGFGWRSDPIHGAKKFHHGIDVGAPIGTPIRAGRAGTVLTAGPAGTYGNLVVLDHGNGVTSRYAHCSALDVVKGQVVAAGEQVGRVGSTGRSTGPHLHFEVRNNGTAVDPSSWLEGSQGSVPPIRLENTTTAPTGRP